MFKCPLVVQMTDDEKFLWKVCSRNHAITHSCSLHGLKLQPPPLTAAASITYGCSLCHIRLQDLKLEECHRLAFENAKDIIA